MLNRDQAWLREARSGKSHLTVVAELQWYRQNLKSLPLKEESDPMVKAVLGQGPKKAWDRFTHCRSPCGTFKLSLEHVQT